MDTQPVLSTLGKKKPLAIDGAKSSGCNKRIVFSVDDMSKMQVDVGLSNKQTLKIAEHLRNKPASRGIIEPRMRPKLRTKNRQLDNMFKVKQANFVQSTKKRTRTKTMINILSFVATY